MLAAKRLSPCRMFGELRLVVAERIEALRPAGRDHRVALDNRAVVAGLEASASPVDGDLRPQGKGADIRQDDFLHRRVALFHGRLHRRPQGHCLVRMDGGVRELAEQLYDKVFDHGKAGSAAYQDDDVDIRKADVGVGKASLDGSSDLLQQLLTVILILF